jgi:hypothetical protein
MFLRELSAAELTCEAEADRYPKWNSMCLLRAMGAETLEAALIDPLYTTPTASEIGSILARFASLIGTDKVMIRTDVRREVKEYIRGGNSYRLADAVMHATDILSAGRAVILLEPTNRFTNQATISIGVDASGDWRAEILGAGFDASDLQRGGTPPEYACFGLPFDPLTFSKTREHAIAIKRLDTITMQQRITSRLETMRKHILPNIGTRVGDGSLTAQNCLEWLAATKQTALFRTHFSVFPDRAFRISFEVAQMIFHYRALKRLSGSFIVASSILEGGRQVFWDVVDAGRKWMI